MRLDWRKVFYGMAVGIFYILLLGIVFAIGFALFFFLINMMLGDPS